MPDMMSGVGIGINDLQKGTPIISGFLLGYVAVLPLIGRLADIVSRQRILLICLALFVIGSCVTATSVELPIMVGGRVLQGIGGGGLVPATLALVADLWPPGKRGTAFGVVGAVQEIGSVLGPLLGAAILVHFGWRDIFWFNAIAGVVLAAVLLVVHGGAGRGDAPAAGEDAAGAGEDTGVIRAVPRWWSALTALAALVAAVVLGLALAAPESLTTSVAYGDPFVPYAGHTSRLATPIGLWGLGALAVALALSARLWWPVVRRADLFGAFLVAVALGCLVLTFASSDPEKQVVGPWGLWLLPVGALALVIAWWWHRRAANPLIARGAVVGRVRPALVSSLLAGAAIVAVVVDIPILARLTVTDSQTTAALILVRFLLAIPVGALLGGWLLKRTGPGLIAAPGLLLAAVGLGLMSRWGMHSLDHGVLTTVVLVMVGLGVGLSIAPINDAALHDAEASEHGVTSSLIVVARMVGMVVGLALLTAIGLHAFYNKVQSLADPTAAQVRAAGVVQVQVVFAGAAVAALVAAVVAIGLGRQRLVGHQDEELAATRVL